MPQEIVVPPAWERITFSALRGVVLIIGAPDVGKSTLTRYLYSGLAEAGEHVSVLDGDVGQSTLGPPTTMTMALGTPGDRAFPPQGRRFRVFVGDISPRGHMLPLVIGAHRLVCRARTEGANTVLYDTTGLVDPRQGGTALKHAKADLLRPDTVIAIERRDELERLLLPMRLGHRTRVIELPALTIAAGRDADRRRARRAACFQSYFQDAQQLVVPWGRLAVYPTPAFSMHRLVAFEDAHGFALGLGIVVGSDPGRHEVSIFTPVRDLLAVVGLRIGSLALDPRNWTESRPPGRFAS